MSNQFEQLDQAEKKIQHQRTLELQRAINSGDVNEIMKAELYVAQQKKKKNEGEQKSFSIHPTEANAISGYYDKKDLKVDERILEALGKSTLLYPIINSRIKQVNKFMTPVTSSYDEGFVIEKRTSIFDEDKPLSNTEKAEVSALVDFVLDTGDREQMFLYDDAEQFTFKFLKDSLTIDGAASELIYTRGGDFKYFKHVDAATIRKAESYDQIRNIERYEEINGYYPTHVQLIHQRPMALFYPHEMYYMVRNPSPRIENHGYGLSEVEILVNTISDFINANLYNSNRFKRGSMPKGFLIGKNLNISADKGQEFLDTFQATISGVANSHRTVYLDGNNWEWVDLEKAGLDMSFLKYIEFLQRIACAIYSMAPEEANLSLEGSESSGIGSASKESQYEWSAKNGLHPLLRKYGKFLDRVVRIKSDGKYRFRFVYDVEERDKEIERAIKSVQSYQTINEVRNHFELEPIEGGDIILSPVYIQSQMGQIQQELEEKEEAQRQEALKSLNSSENPFLTEINEHAEELFG